jgi:uncharacterized protein (DUF58 family)
VSAAASVATSLAEQRYGVRLLLDDHPDPWTPPFHADSSGRLLDRFALLEPGDADRLNGAVTALAGTGGDGLVVAVLGEVDEGVATALARLGRKGTRGVVLLLRTTDWAALPSDRAAELDAERARVAGILTAGGWSLTECRPSDNPASAWARAIGGPRTTAGTQVSASPPPTLSSPPPTHSSLLPARSPSSPPSPSAVGGGPQ